MKNILKTLLLAIFIGISFHSTVASAQFFNNSPIPPQAVFFQPEFNQFNPIFDSERAYIRSLIQFYLNNNQANNFYQPVNNFPTTSPNFTSGTPGFVFTPVVFRNSYPYDREPNVDTQSARDVRRNSAELRGSVDMNDFRNGVVFFVYGQDERKIEYVQDDYDEYSDVKDDEENDDFEILRVDRRLNNNNTYRERVTNLRRYEQYFFTLCVEYQDDNNKILECGDVQDFETDNYSNSSNNDEPNVDTQSARDVRRNSAELRGSVDMNDFRNGQVFFVWGEDENQVDDVDREYRFRNINENGRNLRKRSVETRFSANENFRLDVFNLRSNVDIYFRICVEYRDDDNDNTLKCGNIRDFRVR